MKGIVKNLSRKEKFMNEIFKIAKRPYMKRPIIYQMITKASIILVLALLWERFINQNGRFPMFKYSFAIMGVICVCISWFSYLSLDGMKIHYLNEKKDGKAKKKHKGRDIIDFADEKVISFDELEQEEQTVCHLFSSLLTGLLFVILSII